MSERHTRERHGKRPRQPWRSRRAAARQDPAIDLPEAVGDRGESWSKPFLSPLRGMVAPPYLTAMPGSGDLLAVWTRGMSSRTPLLSAVSKDCGKTWIPVKLLEQSEHFGYGYTSVDFVSDRVLITTMRYPLFSSLERFQVEPLHHERLFLSVPVEWFYRMPR